MTHNRVNEAAQTFRAVKAATAALDIGPAEAKRYRAKVFKSGNSLALRLPAGLGLEAGMEMTLNTEPDGYYTLRRVQPPRRTIDVSGFAGKAPGIQLAPREDFDDSPRDWHLLSAARDGD